MFHFKGGKRGLGECELVLNLVTNLFIHCRSLRFLYRSYGLNWRTNIRNAFYSMYIIFIFYLRTGVCVYDPLTIVQISITRFTAGILATLDIRLHFGRNI